MVGGTTAVMKAGTISEMAKTGQMSLRCLKGSVGILLATVLENLAPKSLEYHVSITGEQQNISVMKRSYWEFQRLTD